MKLSVLKKAGALLLASMMFAACSNGGTTSDAPASSLKPSTSDTPKSEVNDSSLAAPVENGSLLEELVDSADDDAKAREVWDKIFADSAAYYENTFEIGGDGEVYEYQTADGSSFVKDHFLYDTAREDRMASEGGTLYTTQYRVVDNSFGEFENGTGLLIQSGDESGAFLADLSETGEDLIKGKVSKVIDHKYDVASLPQNLIYDGMMTGGYIRSVSPVTNASLYKFDLQKDGDDQKLVISVKDLDEFHKAAATLTPAEDYQDNRPVLILNEITDETYTVTFDKNGVLKQVDTNTFHAISALDDKVYVNIRSEVELESFDSSDASEFTKALSELFAQINDGSLKAGDEFTLKN